VSNVLERLIRGAFHDPRTDSPVPVPIRSIVISDTLAGREADLVAALDLGGTLAVVSDPDTEAALGARIGNALSGAARVMRIQLPRNPEPDERTAGMIEREGGPADAFIAVGSGTINDLCKYASARSGKPYAVFATAPSMNGYTSSNASITVGGLKRSVSAQLPAGVFMDLRVLAASPVRLIRAGVGDTLCRATAQADWLLAHIVRGDPYMELPFLLLSEDEERLFSEPEALLRGDIQALACLARALTLAGLGMAYIGGSFSTSQGEHLISHYMELIEGRGHQPGGQKSYHGEQIGVATITMARLQEELLDRDRMQVQPCDLDESGFTSRYGPQLGPECWKEFLPKRLDTQTAAAMNATLESGWADARRLIMKVAMPSERLRAVLTRLGAPTAPEEVGWSRPAYQEAVAHAAELRNRYTFLDLARDARLLRPDSR